MRVLDAQRIRVIDDFHVTVHTGLNRFTWDLRTSPLPQLGEAPLVQDRRPYYIFYPMKIRGPQVLPGTYRLELSAVTSTVRVPVVVQMDPHHPVAAVDLQAQYDALQGLAATQERAEVAIARLNNLRRQIAALQARSGSLRAPLNAYDGLLSAQLDRLRNPEPSGYRRPAMVSEQLAYLRSTVEQYDGPPTSTQQNLAKQYADEMTQIEAGLSDLLGAQLVSLNAQLRAAHLPELRL